MMTEDLSELSSTKKCLGADCGNDAGTLQCPTCLKIGMNDSYFCSQDCFKKNWVGVHILFLLGLQANRSHVDVEAT